MTTSLSGLSESNGNIDLNISNKQDLSGTNNDMFYNIFNSINNSFNSQIDNNNGNSLYNFNNSSGNTDLNTNYQNSLDNNYLTSTTYLYDKNTADSHSNDTTSTNDSYKENANSNFVNSDDNNNLVKSQDNNYYHKKAQQKDSSSDYKKTDKKADITKINENDKSGNVDENSVSTKTIGKDNKSPVENPQDTQSVNNAASQGEAIDINAQLLTQINLNLPRNKDHNDNKTETSQPSSTNVSANPSIKELNANSNKLKNKINESTVSTNESVQQTGEKIENISNNPMENTFTKYKQTQQSNINPNNTVGKADITQQKNTPDQKIIANTGEAINPLPDKDSALITQKTETNPEISDPNQQNDGKSQINSNNLLNNELKLEFKHIKTEASENISNSNNTISNSISGLKAALENNANTQDFGQKSQEKDQQINSGNNPVLSTNGIDISNLDVKQGTQFDSVLQSSKSQDINPESVLNQISQKVGPELNDKSQLTISLTPENLGKVNINLTSDKGVLTAQITAENQQVKDLLTKSLENLKQNLQTQGINVDKVTVQVQESQSTHHNYQSDNNLYGQNQNSSNTHNQNSNLNSGLNSGKNQEEKNFQQSNYLNNDNFGLNQDNGLIQSNPESLNSNSSGSVDYRV